MAWWFSGHLGQCPRAVGLLVTPLFPSRESKELADLARLHPTSCAANGLNPNLMVTGGPALAGSGRWSADPAAHLATHPWLPRSGSTSMWLAGHPYGECGGWAGGGWGQSRLRVVLGELSAGASAGRAGPWRRRACPALSGPAALSPICPRVTIMAPPRGFSAEPVWGWYSGVGGCGLAHTSASCAEALGGGRLGRGQGRSWAWSLQH